MDLGVPRGDGTVWGRSGVTEGGSATVTGVDVGLRTQGEREVR